MGIRILLVYILPSPLNVLPIEARGAAAALLKRKNLVIDLKLMDIFQEHQRGLGLTRQKKPGRH